MCDHCQLQLPNPRLLREVAAVVPDICDDWQVMAGGRCNRVWRAGGMVVKQYDPAAATGLFPNDLAAEALCLQHYGPLGLAPRLIARGADWIVQAFVPGGTWQADVGAVAALLARLHRTDAPGGLRSVPGGTAALAAQTRILLADAGLPQDLPSCPEVAPPQPCPLHGDAVPGNIVTGPQGLVLVDWQCPAFGDPAEDLAIFLSPAMQVIYRGTPLTLAETEAFLAACPDRGAVARYLALRPLYHLRMIAHCQLRASRGDAGYAAAMRAEAAVLAGL